MEEAAEEKRALEVAAKEKRALEVAAEARMDDLRKQESPEILQLRKECLGRGVAGIKSIGR